MGNYGPHVVQVAHNSLIIHFLGRQKDRQLADKEQVLLRPAQSHQISRRRTLILVYNPSSLSTSGGSSAG